MQICRFVDVQMIDKQRGMRIKNNAYSYLKSHKIQFFKKNFLQINLLIPPYANTKALILSLTMLVIPGTA